MTDNVDAFLFRKPSERTKSNKVVETQQVNVPKLVPPEELVYAKTEKKGIAIIFNHYKFDEGQKLSKREGTDKDCESLSTVLENLGFQTIVHQDLTYTQIKEALRAVAEMDHSSHTCLIVAVMSHGDEGVIYAKDHKYPPEILWQAFAGNKCRSLIGKPKLFFLQACRGEKTDSGVEVEFDAISRGGYKIPEMADILVMYSTYEGYFSWRSGVFGSWFIQTLCRELHEHSKEKDLLTILTYVNHRVACEYESNVPHIPGLHKKKQMCTIVSTLTKILYLGLP